MTMEEILARIKDEHGKSALRDGGQLLGLFKDYSHGQMRGEANAVKTFLDCSGNTRIINLSGEPEVKQQTEYHRLVQEMVRDHNMQESAAKDICNAFWRVAIGSEPPGQEPTPQPTPPEPAPAPPQPAPTHFTAQKPIPTKRTSSQPKPKSAFRQRLDGMDKKARRTFLFGLVGVALFIPFFIIRAIFFSIDGYFFTPEGTVLLPLIVFYWGNTLRRVNRVWRKEFLFGDSLLLSSPESIYVNSCCVYSIFAFMINLVMSMMIAGPVFIPQITHRFLWIDFTMMMMMCLAFGCCGVFNTSWHIRKLEFLTNRMKESNNKKGGKI